MLNADRNQPRKRIDITIKGFSLFARDKPPSVKLYLHMGVEDCGWNIVLMAKRHGIEDRLILTADMPFLPVVSNEVLNCIYNACDVGINTSIGEGWGLVSFEHAATGAGQIVPRHSACEELWQDSALMLEPCMTLTTEKSLTEGHFVAPEAVANSLNQLYEERNCLPRSPPSLLRPRPAPSIVGPHSPAIGIGCLEKFSQRDSSRRTVAHNAIRTQIHPPWSLRDRSGLWRGWPLPAGRISRSRVKAMLEPFVTIEAHRALVSGTKPRAAAFRCFGMRCCRIGRITCWWGSRATWRFDNRLSDHTSFGAKATGLREPRGGDRLNREQRRPHDGSTPAGKGRLGANLALTMRTAAQIPPSVFEEMHASRQTQGRRRLNRLTLEW